MAIRKQKGVVLVVALIFLVALTAVAAVLMSSTTVDMKMAGASQDKVAATQDALGANDQVIQAQVTKAVADTNNFTLPIALYPIQNIAVSAVDTNATIAFNNPNNIETDCPANKVASSVQVFKCNYLQVQIDKTYGRSNTNTVSIRAGIAQQLLNVGK
jgi:uncharacterized protein (UPF0333 family)